MRLKIHPKYFFNSRILLMQMCKYTENNSRLETEMIMFFIPRWKITNTWRFVGMFPLQRKYLKKLFEIKSVQKETLKFVSHTGTRARTHAHKHARKITIEFLQFKQLWEWFSSRNDLPKQCYPRTSLHLQIHNLWLICPLDMSQNSTCCLKLAFS